MTSLFRLCQVETLAGHAGPGEPRRFFHKGRWLAVDAIEDRWYEGGADPERELILYFKVISGEDIYFLRFLPYFQRWQVMESDLE